MTSFVVRLAGGAVHVRSSAREVEDLVSREIGEYFGIEPLGTSRSTERPLATITHTVAEPALPTCPGDWAVLHDGSHSYDTRHGMVWRTHAGGKDVASHHTGSLIRIRPGDRHLEVVNAVPAKGASDVRRLIRDLLFLPWLEAHGGVVVHGAAVVDPDRGAVIIMGDRGAGKTTLFMSAARAGIREALTCERVVLVPEPEGLRAYACPENISVFAGTLRQFPELSSLADETATEHDWVRDHKVRVPWRTLHGRLGLTPVNGVLVDRILFPRWDPVSSDAESVRDSHHTFAALLTHTVTGRDVNRPDWLGWFAPRHTEATLATIAALPAQVASWTSLDDAARLLKGA